MLHLQTYISRDAYAQNGSEYCRIGAVVFAFHDGLLIRQLVRIGDFLAVSSQKCKCRFSTATAAAAEWVGRRVGLCGVFPARVGCALVCLLIPNTNELG